MSRARFGLFKKYLFNVLSFYFIVCAILTFSYSSRVVCRLVLLMRAALLAPPPPLVSLHWFFPCFVLWWWCYLSLVHSLPSFGGTRASIILGSAASNQAGEQVHETTTTSCLGAESDTRKTVYSAKCYCFGTQKFQSKAHTCVVGCRLMTCVTRKGAISPR